MSLQPFSVNSKDDQFTSAALFRKVFIYLCKDFQLRARLNPICFNIIWDYKCVDRSVPALLIKFSKFNFLLLAQLQQIKTACQPNNSKRFWRLKLLPKIISTLSFIELKIVYISFTKFLHLFLKFLMNFKWKTGEI